MILYGKPLIGEMTAKLSERTLALKARGTEPVLAVVRAGEDPAAGNYVASILRRGAGVGVTVRDLMVEEDYEALCRLLRNLAGDPAVHGILLCLPLPGGLKDRQGEIKALIPPEKDVDGVTDGSAAGVFLGNGRGYAPCTAESSMRLLEFYGVEFTGKRACVVGRSAVIGKPAAMMLLDRNATVTVCHSRTENLAEVTRQADILIACAGSAGLIGPEHVKPGAAVVDVGTNWLPEAGKIVGDVQFDRAEPVAGAISPVPGGVGGVTATVLMEHVVTAAENSR